MGCLAFAEERTKGPSPDAVIAELKAGNQRHVSTTYKWQNHKTRARRAEMAKGQHPGAIILSCSDSRVPPEIVFDQGLGDLFVVRVAGNIVEDAGIGSIEYAAEHLGSKVIVVLGHERCGAVDATMKGGEAPGHIADLVKKIQPSLEQSKDMPGDKLDNAVKMNVHLAVEQLKKSQPILAELISHGKLKIVGARYDLDTGVVTWLE
jgi:carbonic anhydrase